MKQSFKDGLVEVKTKPSHRKVKKFLKKRKLTITLVVTHSRGTVYYFCRPVQDGKKTQYRPYCIVVPHPKVRVDA
jgi:hypothetical protein